VRNHVAGSKDFIKRLNGRTVTSVNRRGKFMWLSLDDDHALVTHLGMSGQVLVQPLDADPEKHLRVRCTFTDSGRAMHFVDQRTFGGMAIEQMVEDLTGRLIPESVQHIALDPLDDQFDPETFITGIRKKNTQVKRAILDQTLISGIGNIYADEALWRAKIHWATPTQRLTRAQATTLLTHATEVMTQALSQGGTSFDALYVNVNGESGYFSQELNAYGREDEPCDRCGSIIVREAFANRSSFRCPRCQRKPRS
jgi:formamidopyrimidine-DNA glycosylase